MNTEGVNAGCCIATLFKLSVSLLQASLNRNNEWKDGWTGETDRARIGELQCIESRKGLFEQVGRDFDEGLLMLMRERLYLCNAKTENERLHHE